METRYLRGLLPPARRRRSIGLRRVPALLLVAAGAASPFAATVGEVAAPSVVGPAVYRLESASFGSAEALGLQGNFDSFAPNTAMRTLSRDGRYVAFVSLASTLVPGDTAIADVFVRDRDAGTTALESRSTAGIAGNGGSAAPGLTDDGRYLVFHSEASNLVGGDTNTAQDIFVRDRVGGSTTRVSVASGGAQSNGLSDDPSISAVGRYVAFLSLATNLVAGDSNGVSDIFVHDRQTGLTTRVSVSSQGAQANGASATPLISADGRHVAFYSWANNLIASDTNAQPDVFVHDRQTGATTLVSRDSAGLQGNAGSFTPAISGDGRLVAFESLASNLVPFDGNGASDVFVHDRVTGSTNRLSLSSAGIEGNAASNRASISQDGNIVTFESSAVNLVAGDGNAAIDVFARDRAAATTTRLSVDSAGDQANNASQYAAVSGDGRVVAFQSSATDLVGTDSNGRIDIYVHDRATSATVRASLASDVASNRDGYTHLSACCLRQLSADGRMVAFESDATNLIAGDTNLMRDIFVRDRTAATTARASVGIGGAQANGTSYDGVVSTDGEHVAYASSATNLVASDANVVEDVFVRDLALQATERISVSSAEVEANARSTEPSLSANGRHVAFESTASNLVAGDSNATIDIFVRDRQAGTTMRASVSSAGVQGNAISVDAAMADNGRHVAFVSSASTLMGGDTNGRSDVFVRDLLAGETTRASVDSTGAQANDASSGSAISADGRYVAFESTATNLVADDTNGTSDVFVRDRAAGTTTRASLSSSDVQGNGFSRIQAISPDGRFVVFASVATNLYPDDVNGEQDIFVRDRLLGITSLVSTDRMGTQGVYRSELASISADGRVLAFNSGSYNWLLDAGVDNPGGASNTAYDVFVASIRVDVLFRDGFEASP